MKSKNPKRKVPILSITSNGSYDKEHLVSHKDFNRALFTEVVDAIKEGISNKKTTVTLFELDASGYIIDLEKENWVKSLESAVEYYQKLENYEMCALCMKLIKKLNYAKKI